MNKCICDICKRNTADKHFKVKEKREFPTYEYGLVLMNSHWINIDICEGCYAKLMNIKEDR